MFVVFPRPHASSSHSPNANALPDARTRYIAVPPKADLVLGAIPKQQDARQRFPEECFLGLLERDGWGWKILGSFEENMALITDAIEKSPPPSAWNYLLAIQPVTSYEPGRIAYGPKRALPLRLIRSIEDHEDGSHAWLDCGRMNATYFREAAQERSGAFLARGSVRTLVHESRNAIGSCKP